MATKSITSLGLGNADLTAIGKLSETGLSQVEIADAVVEGDKLKKGNIPAGQVGAYTKAEVDTKIADIPTTDLSDYYNKAQVDSLIDAIPETDLSNYYNKTQVDSLIDAIPETDLTNYYNKTQVDSLIPDISTKQDTLVSATNIKTINGQSVLGSGDLVISGGGAVDLSEYYKKTETYSKVEVDTKIADIPTTDLSGYYDKTETYNKSEVDTKIADIPPTDLSGYYNKTETETLLSNKVDKVTGKGLSTNDFTNTFKQALELKKVQDISTDSVTKKLVVNYTDSTVANLNINDIITDVKVSGATLDATTNVLTLTSTDGGADVTVDLSDFVNSGELTSALSGKADKIHSHTTSDITGLDTTLSNKVTKNEAIMGATKTKITYDSNGLVTGGADLIEADLPNISQSKIINLVSDLSSKQSSLISGTNIKTINGQSVLGSGNIEITGGGSGGGLNPNEDITLSAGKGVIMTSENGTIYKLYIDNDGRLTTEAI